MFLRNKKKGKKNNIKIAYHISHALCWSGLNKEGNIEKKRKENNNNENNEKGLS